MQDILYNYYKKNQQKKVKVESDFYLQKFCGTNKDGPLCNNE